MGRLLSIFFLLLSFAAAAQTPQQQGVVKTRGRLVNGKVVRGQGIPNAVIQLEERDVQSQAKDGSFSFPVRNGRFRVNGVTKKGYQLLDQQTCREYAYSRDTLYLVMEAPEQQLADQLAQERKLRRDLQRRLQQREDEIEALNLSIEEKNRLLMEIDQEREDNEKIIKDLSAYYAALDYDQLDAFQQQVSACLENGELDKADSLLRSRGRMEDRIRSVMGEQAAEAREEAELDERREALDRSKSGTRRKLEDIAADCYNYHQRFLLDHRIDSAAYYLTLRADLDTTNVEWQEEAGEILSDYLGDYKISLSYTRRALRQAIIQYGENSEDVANLYNNLGIDSHPLGELKMSLAYHKEALRILESVFGQDDPALAKTYSYIGSVYRDLGDYPAAFDNLSKAQSLIQDSESTDMALVLEHLGNLHAELGDYGLALQNLLQGLAIYQQHLGAEHPNLATAYGNVGNVYAHMGEFKKALEYFQVALDIRQKVFRESHPQIATLYNNIGLMEEKLGHSDLARDYYEKSLDIRLKCFGTSHTSVATSYNNLAGVYYSEGDYDKALEYLFKALDIRKAFYGPMHSEVASSYNNIAEAYKGAEDYASALEYSQKALDVFETLFGTENPNVAWACTTIGAIYFYLEDYQQALTYGLKALAIKEKVLGAGAYDTGTSYYYVGLFYWKLGVKDSALTYMNKALAIYQPMFGDDDPRVRTIQSNIAKMEELISAETAAQ